MDKARLPSITILFEQFSIIFIIQVKKAYCVIDRLKLFFLKQDSL